jgi:hypothetical protein
MSDLNDELLERLTSTAMEFLVPLRMGEGLDEHRYQQLVGVLRLASQRWRGDPFIPKRAAGVFVDLFDAVWSSSFLYPEPQSSQIRMRADRLAELVRECVALE